MEFLWKLNETFVVHQAHSRRLISVWDYDHHLGRQIHCNKMSYMVHVCKIVKGHSWRKEHILLWGNHGWFHKIGNIRRTNLTSLDKVKWKSLSHILTLCNPMDCDPPGSSVHGILQARILEWVAISSSQGSSQLRDRICGSCVAGRFFTTEPPRRWSLLFLEQALEYCGNIII